MDFSINPSARYPVASIGCLFLAICVLRRCDPTKKVRGYIDCLQLKGISVENLLTHTSGLCEFTLDMTPENILDQDLVKYPIGDYHYSLVNYIIL